MLNLGLRYSLLPPAYEETDRYRIFSPAAYDPRKAVTVNTAGLPLNRTAVAAVKL